MVLMFAAGTILLGTGCYKDKTVTVDAPVITRTVSFSQDIIPIFNSSCNGSGCHTSGGQTPNLGAATAFNALTTGSYLNVDAPDKSLIYLKLTGQKGTVMPVSGSNKDYNALILAWITQGAKNN